MDQPVLLVNENTVIEHTAYGDLFTEPLFGNSAQLTLLCVHFRAETDRHNTPVSEQVLYGLGKRSVSGRGQVFSLSFPSQNIARVYIILTPDYVLPTLTVQNGMVEIDAQGYPIICGTCRTDGVQKFCRDWYRTRYRPERIVAMSNTWGDRGGREVVSEEFVLKEIDVGAEIGVDVVQVDDGWQKGVPNAFDEAGLRVFEGDFWSLKPNTFPHGIDYLPHYAASRGIQMGLWFAPHSRNRFEHLERDIGILSRACNEWGYRYFKLDMLQLNDRAQCERMQELLSRMEHFEAHAEVELDVTADRRLGYFAAASYGTLFVENRYTAWGNYYPHTTLRNLWKLAAYVPSSKFQFELVNPTLYTEQYEKDDPLRPALYDIDYLFASVMVSNPLFWMEMQRLPIHCRQRLKSIVSHWKCWREELTRADVRPIGEEPSGCSMTGFVAKDEKSVHVILLREVTNRDTYTFVTNENLQNAEVICSNTDVQVTIDQSSVTVRFEKPRAYVWLRAGFSS